MLNSLTVKSKLGISFSVLTLILIFISLLSLHEISASNQRFSDYIAGVGQRKETASKLLVAAQQRAISARNLVLVGAAELKTEQAAVAEAHEQVTNLLKDLNTQVPTDIAPNEKQKYQELIATITAIESRYGPVALDIVDLATRGERDSAVRKINAECLPLLRKLIDSVNAFILHETKEGEANLAAADTAYSEQKTQVILTCLIAAGIALVMGGLISTSLLKALGAEPSALSTIAQRVASGDLRAITETRHASPDSVLASLGNMQVRLSELIREVNQSSSVIFSAAENLSANTEQASAGIAQQKQEVDQVATAIHEMAATVQEVARNTDGVAREALVADQQAQASEKMTRDVVIAIQHLANEVSHSVTAMSRLEEESKHIGGVLDVIKSVADQTNLLALNAAIEAARAGDAGRGFAVVADEVRGLAKHTQDATHKIAELIVSLQNISQETAGMMQKCRNLADDAVTQVTDTGSAVGNITHMIANIQQMMQQIATAAEEQSAVAEEINLSVTRVRDIVDRSATASEKTASSSTTLTTLGANLREKINQFQI